MSTFLAKGNISSQASESSGGRVVLMHGSIPRRCLHNAYTLPVRRAPRRHTRADLHRQAAIQAGIDGFCVRPLGSARRAQRTGSRGRRGTVAALVGCANSGLSAHRRRADGDDASVACDRKAGVRDRIQALVLACERRPAPGRPKYLLCHTLPDHHPYQQASRELQLAAPGHASVQRGGARPRRMASRDSGVGPIPSDGLH
jgi:hypothetical protein